MHLDAPLPAQLSRQMQQQQLRAMRLRVMANQQNPGADIRRIRARRSRARWR